jgi:RNA polymerase sigma-70 factor (ECF subfamily)
MLEEGVSLDSATHSAIPVFDVEIAAAFEGIVEQHQRRLIGLAYHMLGNLDEARDQAQEAFVRLWQQRDKRFDERTLAALLARIIVNLCIDRLREKKRRSFFPLNEENAVSTLRALDDPHRDAEAVELGETLAAAMARLKPRQKAIFILRDVEGRSVRETAEIIGCSDNNVLVNLHKARKNLRKWLAPYIKS